MENSTATDKNDATTDLEAMNLKGQVKECMQICYLAKPTFVEIVADKILLDYVYYKKNFLIVFDKSGNKTREIQYSSDGRRESIFQNKREIEYTNYSDNDKFKRKYLQYYNENGNLSESTEVDEHGNIVSKSVSAYNNNKDLISCENFSTIEGNLVLNSTTKYEYNEQGKRTKQMEYDGSGNLKTVSLYFYDNNNRQIESKNIEYSDAKEKITYWNRFILDDFGNPVRLEFLNDRGQVSSSTTYHPAYGHNGTLLNFDKKYYGISESFERYDRNGNWVQKIVQEESQPTEIFNRTILYYGEDENYSLVFPDLSQAKDKNRKEPKQKHDLPHDKVQWIAEGHSSNLDGINLIRYYASLFNELPSVLHLNIKNIEVVSLKKMLMNELMAQEIHSYFNLWDLFAEKPVCFSLRFPHYEGYILVVNSINPKENDLYRDSEEVDFDRYGFYHIGMVQLLRPSVESGKRDEEFENDLGNIVDRCVLHKKPEKPRIHIIEMNSEGYHMKEHAVSDNFLIGDLNLNYGQGFEKFHNELMNRFNTSQKGLVLLHGKPGTGKTYYIRHLLRSMASNRKIVIYLPPDMVDQLVDPHFMTFLINVVRDWSEDGMFCVLLIEDAEPLLAKRQEGVRIQGVTNLLNMTDGLLNDMLKFQIICTFNVDLRKLDSALLRPGRLLARKEFKELDELDANILGQKLGVKHHFTKPATLSEIYAMRANQGVLLHDVEQNRDASKPMDDF